MDRQKGVAVFFLLVLFGGFCSAAIQTIMPGRWSVKYESGYNVETIFDGSKLGIEPFSVEVLPDGDLVVLDSASSNIYRIALPLSKCCAPPPNLYSFLLPRFLIRRL